MTTTETCFKVAVSDTTATTALSDVRECDGNKGRRKRSIDDTPSHDVNLGDISPSSSSIGGHTSEMDMLADPTVGVHDVN